MSVNEVSLKFIDYTGGQKILDLSILAIYKKLLCVKPNVRRPNRMREKGRVKTLNE